MGRSEDGSNAGVGLNHLRVFRHSLESSIVYPLMIHYVCAPSISDQCQSWIDGGVSMRSNLNTKGTFKMADVNVNGTVWQGAIETTLKHLDELPVYPLHGMQGWSIWMCRRYSNVTVICSCLRMWPDSYSQVQTIEVHKWNEWSCHTKSVVAVCPHVHAAWEREQWIQGMNCTDNAPYGEPQNKS